MKLLPLLAGSLFFIADLAAAGPVGKIFRKKDNHVEITGPGIGTLKVGGLLVVVTKSGHIPLRIRQTFHTKIDAAILNSNVALIAAGDPVYLKGKEPGTPAPEETAEPELIADEKVLATAVEFLTPGWDIFNGKGRRVQASYTVLGQNGVPAKIQFEFNLTGAEKEHEYTVGMHLFDPTDPAQPPATAALGYPVGQVSNVSREDYAAVIIARDFGTIKTDASGNGSATFTYPMPQNDLHFQFTVRTGICRPEKRIVSGCNVVFRSGAVYGKRLIHLKPR